MNATDTAGGVPGTGRGGPVTTEYLAGLIEAQGQKIDEMYRLFAAHRPAIERAAALMDPGAGMRKFMAGRRHAVP